MYAYTSEALIIRQELAVTPGCSRGHGSYLRGQGLVLPPPEAPAAHDHADDEEGDADREGDDEAQGHGPVVQGERVKLEPAGTGGTCVIAVKMCKAGRGTKAAADGGQTRVVAGDDDDESDADLPCHGSEGDLGFGLGALTAPLAAGTPAQAGRQDQPRSYQPLDRG